MSQTTIPIEHELARNEAFSLILEAMKLKQWREDFVQFFKDITGLVPHPKQIPLLQAIPNLDIKQLLTTSARGCGKTMIVALVGVWTAVVLAADLNKSMEILILAGSGDQASKCYDWMIKHCKNQIIAARIKDGPFKKVTTFKDGSRIEVLNCSKEEVSGPHPNLLIADECAHIPDHILEMALPMPNPVTPHRWLLDSTPYDFVTLFVSYWEKAGDYDHPETSKNGYLRFPFPNQEEADWIDKDIVKGAQVQHGRESSYYQIHYLGLPTMIANTLIPPDAIRDSRITEKPVAIGELPIDFGIDWGITAPTVLEVVQDRPEGRHALLEVVVMQGKTADYVHEVIERYYKLYRPRRVYCDHSHEWEVQRLRNKGMPAEGIAFQRDKSLMQANLKRVFETHRIDVWERETLLLQQLMRYTEKTKEDDDLVDALQLALRGSANFSTQEIPKVQWKLIKKEEH